MVYHQTTLKPQWPERKEEKWSKEFWMSNSLPNRSRNGDPSVTFLDDTSIQIIIAPATDCTPKLPHEQTPLVEATSDAANIEENESKLYLKTLLKNSHKTLQN